MYQLRLFTLSQLFKEIITFKAKVQQNIYLSTMKKTNFEGNCYVTHVNILLIQKGGKIYRVHETHFEPLTEIQENLIR